MRNTTRKLGRLRVHPQTTTRLHQHKDHQEVTKTTSTKQARSKKHRKESSYLYLNQRGTKARSSWMWIVARTAKNTRQRLGMTKSISLRSLMISVKVLKACSRIARLLGITINRMLILRTSMSIFEELDLKTRETIKDAFFFSRNQKESSHSFTSSPVAFSR